MTIEKVEELEVEMLFCETCGESEESDNSYWHRSYAYDDAYCDDCHHSMYESGELEYCQGTCEELIWSEDIYYCDNCQSYRPHYLVSSNGRTMFQCEECEF